jgi:hypothetical protein
VAARVREKLASDVAVVGGPYGQFKVLVDGEVVVDGGRLAALGILPSAEQVLEALAARSPSLIDAHGAPL